MFDTCLHAFFAGKLKRDYDESIAVYSTAQRDESNVHRLDPIDFGRRVAQERTLDDLVDRGHSNALGSLCFDASGHFLLYPSMIGIKLLNVTNNSLARVLGTAESGVRFLSLALYQGKPAKDRAGGTSSDATMQSDGSAVVVAGEDPTLFACGYNSERFYIL